jgi:DNA mismatch repair protein MutL
MRHIIDEFTRVALAFPAIFFSLSNNGQEMFHLEAGSLKQRILQLLGNNYSAKLVTVKEETDYLNIYGFVGKPDIAKKTRGDQYFFVNNRFIKSGYLNHAVMSAYQEMIAADSFPMYVLFIDLDPAQVDVNVHPTKQEIKFEDEKIIYAFVQAAIKHALAQFSVMPALDFDLDASIQQLPSIQQPFTEERKSAAASTSLFKGFTQKHQAHFIERSDAGNWKDFDETGQAQQPAESSAPLDPLPVVPKHIAEEAELSQILNSYIVVPSGAGFLLIHQQAAHERIIYEQLKKASKANPVASQQSMFPVTIELVPADAVLLEELMEDLQQLGYGIEPFGKNTFVVRGTPADIEYGNEKHSIDLLLEQYKHFSNDLKFSKREKLLRSMAWQQSIKSNTPLSQNEMKTLCDDLFDCETPNCTANGKPTYLEFKKDELDKMFGR